MEWSGVGREPENGGRRGGDSVLIPGVPTRPTHHTRLPTYNNSTSVNNALSHHSRITYVPGFLTVHDTVGLSFAGGLTPGGGRLIS